MELKKEKFFSLRMVLIDDLNRSKIKKISRDTALMHDLGLYGEDVDIYLIDFIEEEYGISRGELNEVLGCEIMEYFRPEFYSRAFIVFAFVIPFLWYFRDKYENKKHLRFTVGMLEDAIEEVLKNRENNL